MLFFPWPGDDGQGKEPQPPAQALRPGSNRCRQATGLVDRARRDAIFSPRFAWSPTLRAGSRFARSPSPDRAKNIVPSVLSVSLWFNLSCASHSLRFPYESRFAGPGRIPSVDSAGEPWPAPHFYY